MSVTELIQLYAPLCGLLAVVFWLGVLSQRVNNLQDDVDDLKSDRGTGGSGDRLTRLEVNMENMTNALASTERAMQGVQRQLANLMQPGSPIQNFDR